MAGSSDEIHVKPAALAALMIALFGGNALLTTQWTKPDAVRPDPFTGSDGQRMRADLQREIDQLTRRVDALRNDVNLCLGAHYHSEKTVATK